MNTTAANVTVVVPMFNAQRTIADTIASVLAQSEQSWRMVLVDDGSSDRTVEIARTFEDPRISIVQQSNKGVSSARNRGLAEVHTPYVMFLDSDDQIHPTALERLSICAQQNPGACVIFGTTMRYNTRWEMEPGQKPPVQHRFNSGQILEAMINHDRVFWNGGQAIFDCSAVRLVGGYNEGLRLSEDWELFCRLAATGDCINVGPQDEILRHQVRPDSAAPTLGPDWQNHLAAIDAVFNNQSIRAKFGAKKWETMRKEATANSMFEAGRQNFIRKSHRAALSLMTKSLLMRPTKRRLAFLGLALGTLILRKPLHARFRQA